MKTNWNTKKQWSNNFALLLIRWFALRFGRTAARCFLVPISLYYLITNANLRKHCDQYLRKALGKQVRWWHIYRHIHTSASVILDRVFMLAGKMDKFDVKLHGLDMVLAQQKAGGALFFGAHLGCSEILRCIGIREMEAKIRIMMHTQETQNVIGYLHALAPDLADTIIPIGQPDSLLKVSQALNEGCQIGVLADRILNDDKVVRVPCLGQMANVPLGPMLMASIFKVPIILFFGLYAGGNRYDIYFERFTDGLQIQRDKRDAQLTEKIAEFMQRVEHYTKQYPYNWFNFYDYWAEQKKP